MNCPKCKDVEIKKASFHAPYACRKCGGMWVVDSKFPDAATTPVEPDGDSSETVDFDQKTGMCPSGHGILIRARVDMDEPFYLEKCTACGGIWFDKGEWLRIAHTSLAGNLHEIWSKAWQRKHGREKNRENFLAMNRKLLGDDVFNAIMALAEKLKAHPEKLRAVALLQEETNKPS